MPSTQCGRATHPEWVDASEASARSSTARAARAWCRDATGSISFTADQLDQAEQYLAAVALGLEMLRRQARHQHQRAKGQERCGSCAGRFVMSSPDAGDERGLALRTDAARTRILTGMRLGAEERAALERIVLHAAIVVDHARALTGMDHHGDLADRIGELIAAAGQAEQRRAGS